VEAYETLEHEVGDWAGYHPRHVVACSSGTAALHLSLEAMELPPRSEVAVPDFTMVACPRAVVLAGMIPLFIDCDDRLLMDLNLFNPRTRLAPAAVIAVHVYGRRLDMDRLAALTYDGRRAVVIEDLAEAHGVRPHVLTDAACWSFYRNKIVAGEEGGAVAFKDPARAAVARELRSLGFTAAHDFTHRPRGHNYRMANLLATSVRESLARFERNVAERRRVESWYDELCPDAYRMPPRDAPWVYDLRIPMMGMSRQDVLVRSLNQRGCAARHGFKPMHWQAEWRQKCRLIADRDNETRAEVAAREVIYLPLAPGTTREQVEEWMGVVASAG
jgi:perosamine synthetase